MTDPAVFLKRRLEQARQDLEDAYQRARAGGYLPTWQMADLEDADRHYRHLRAAWHETLDPDATAGQAPGRPRVPADSTIDLTAPQAPWRDPLDGTTKASRPSR